MYELDQLLQIYFVLENCDIIMHLRFNFDACPMHSPFGFVHLTHQNLSAHALFCHNSLAKVNTQLLIYKHWPAAHLFARGVQIGCSMLSCIFQKVMINTEIQIYNEMMHKL